MKKVLTVLIVGLIAAGCWSLPTKDPCDPQGKHYGDAHGLAYQAAVRELGGSKVGTNEFREFEAKWKTNYLIEKGCIEI